ncbi:MAG: hypothetical protein K6A40_04225 [Solobacterium sp.]|nr:hypothetical protein [Solobacterium sp.]
MNQSNQKTVRIVHVCLLGAAMILSITAFASWLAKGFTDGSLGTGATIVKLAVSVVQIIALGAGILYGVSGYKKNAAGYYKAFTVITAIALGLSLADACLAEKPDVVSAIFYAVALAGVVALSTVKDLGRQKSIYILMAVLAAILVLLFKAAFGFSSYGEAGFAMVSSVIANAMMILTLGAMLAAKYLDKKARGRN